MNPFLGHLDDERPPFPTHPLAYASDLDRFLLPSRRVPPHRHRQSPPGRGGRHRGALLPRQDAPRGPRQEHPGPTLARSAAFSATPAGRGWSPTIRPRRCPPRSTPEDLPRHRRPGETETCSSRRWPRTPSPAATRRCWSCSLPPACGSASCAARLARPRLAGSGATGRRQGRQGAHGAFGRSGRGGRLAIGSGMEASCGPGRPLPGRTRPGRTPLPALPGGRLSHPSLRRLLDRFVATAGLAADVHPRTPRHTFATHLLEGGADLGPSRSSSATPPSPPPRATPPRRRTPARRLPRRPSPSQGAVKHHTPILLSPHQNPPW